MSSDDRRSRAAERRLDQDLAGRFSAAAAPGNAYLAAWQAAHDPTLLGPRVETGLVVDVVPGGYAYRVSAARRSFLWCSPGGVGTSFGVTGPRSATSYALGSVVYFVRHPETPEYGTILAAEPHWAVHTGNHPADSVWPFFRTGMVEAAHQFPVSASANLAATGDFPLSGVDVVDLAAGRPVGSTAVGEWGVVAETGVGVFADPFQAYLRADEATGVFAFYPDQLLRVAGHNLVTASVVREDEQLEDEGELLGFTRGCVYPWEAYGLWRWNQVTPAWFAPPVANHGYNAGQGVALNDPFTVLAGSGFAAREPEYFNQIPAARVYDWAGYLGQGGRRVVAAPMQLEVAYPAELAAGAGDATVTWEEELVGGDGPYGRGNLDNQMDPTPGGRLVVDGDELADTLPLAVPPNTRGQPNLDSGYGDAPDQPGLLEIQQSLAGGYRVRSARHVILAKRPSIPVPRPLRRPEDPYGDNNTTTYRASGLNNGTVVHKVQADLPHAYGPAQRGVLLPDCLAYLFNWDGLHPFAYHVRDWKVAQEGAAGQALPNQVPPDYSWLADHQYMAAPAAVAVDVDHRYGYTDVTPNESVFGLLDDGSVVLRDGWGSELRMAGGNIELHAAGDLRLFLGRSLIAWAGHDVVLRAHDSADLTAANGDLRLKADRNLQALAGNSGCGGMTFESKASCYANNYTGGRQGEEVVSSGFTFLAPKSQFLVQTGDIALMLDPDGDADGRIYLNAADRHVHTISKTVVHRVFDGGGVVQLFDGPTPSDVRANEFNRDHALFGTPVFVKGSVFATECVTAGTWLTAGQWVAGANSSGRGGLVGSWSGSVIANISAVATRETYLSSTYMNAVGNEQVRAPGAQYAEVSMRTSAQYLSAGFEYWQGHWQTVAYAAGQDLTLPLWSEPAVVGLRSALPSRPHPGARWTSGSGYRSQPQFLVNTAAGWVAVDRDTHRADYEAPAVPPPDNLNLSTHYLVTVAAGD